MPSGQVGRTMSDHGHTREGRTILRAFRFLSRFIDWMWAGLGRIRSSTYFLVYFMLIPVFAIIYSQWLPGDFYHSTIQHEIPFQERKEITCRILNSALDDTPIHSYLLRKASTPARRIEAVSMVPTSKVSLPKTATGKTPRLLTLTGLGHECGFMSTATATDPVTALIARL